MSSNTIIIFIYLYDCSLCNFVLLAKLIVMKYFPVGNLKMFLSVSYCMKQKLHACTYYN